MTACASCAAVNPDGAAFCENCGKPVVALETASPTPTPVVVPPLATTIPDKEYLPGEAPSVRLDGSPPPPPEPPRSAVCVSCGSKVEDEYCTSCGVRQPSPRDHYQETPAKWVAGVCDKGIVHARNEDAMSTWAAGDGRADRRAVLVVCDGVTTAPLSERASFAATVAARDVLAAAFNTATRTDESWAAALGAACTAAQAQAVAVARSLGDPPEPPSCTFVAAVIDGARVHAGWCGDSRAYLFFGTVASGLTGQILSVDDSIASQMIANGTPRAQAEADHRAHTITRWLGADAPDPTAKTASFDAPDDGLVVVVSDGLWNYASEPAAVVAQITQGLTEPFGLTPLAVAKKLVAFANAQGGSDNITVTIAATGAVLDPVSSSESAPSPAPSSSQTT